MKNLHKMLFAFLSIALVSCTADDVENRPVLESITTPEVLAPEANKSYVLIEADKDKDADRFVWSAAKYSDKVVVEYALMIDVQGGDFTKAQKLITTSDLTQVAVTVKNLNEAVIALGAEPGAAKLFDVKVMSTVAGNLPMMSKNVLTINVTAYTGLVPYAFTDWYLIGGAVEGGWENNVDTAHQPMFRGGVNSNIYKFTGYFIAGNFKLISQKGSWAFQLGNAGSGAIEIKDNAGEFTIPSTGYYTFTFNTTTLTYSLIPFNANSASIYSRIGFLGSSRTGTDAGWNGDDTSMTVSTFNSHTWSLSVSLYDGKGKFRANNVWDTSWGGDTSFSGFTGNGASGGDIPVAKTKYKVYFNDLDGSYLMLPNQE
ncbi:SusE domain-containing protein [Flavobacterium sp. F-380]|uniref:SusE domain-containing protein n=1 Tax=Flavobacterium kayseriense TaxID=2764714 RepID=A0ABR7J608_9FLAO|nr:SusE domain-containing protein [Flavobacterium kayseriense]MBC5840898.1 SusE domain-containing protein [Flavobacterium kayseriense]MBC5846433.1 SusE domain-containing protein [Flavobacterium kayseriense]